MSRWYLAVVVAVAARDAAASTVDEARALYETRNYPAAEAVFKQRAMADPHDDESIYYLGKLAIVRGDYTAAVRFLERAVVLSPRQSDYHLWLGNGYAWAASIAPYADKAALGRKCLAAYRKALELNPDNLRAHFSLMNFYRHVPAFLGGGMANAWREAGEIRRRDSLLGTFALSVLYAHEKNYPQAFAALEEILRKEPHSFAANCALGSLAVETGRHLSEGEAALRRCLNLHPTEDDEGPEKVQWYLGRIAEIQHQPPVARDAYAACLKLKPTFKPAEEALARLTYVSVP